MKYPETNAWNGPPVSPILLKDSDTGKLLALIGSLCKLNSTKIHCKINEYFTQICGVLSFIIEKCPDNVCEVKAIGKNPLEKPIIFQESSLMLQNCISPSWVARGEIEGNLCCWLEAILWEEWNEMFNNCLLCPFKSSVNEDISLYIALINVKTYIRCEEYYDGVVTECMRHCYSILRSISNFEHIKEENKKYSSVTTSYVKLVSSIGTNMIFEEAQNLCSDVFQVTDSLLYLVNKNLEPNLKSRIIKTDKFDINLNSEKMATSHAIKNGQPLYWNYLSQEPLYGHCKQGTPPKSLLAIPVFYDDAVLALIEMYSNVKEFCPSDVTLARLIGQLAGEAFNAHNDIEDYIRKKQITAFHDCLLLRRTKPFEDNLLKHALKCTDALSYHRFPDIRFDLTLVPEIHEICMCLNIFERFGLVKEFRIRKDKLARFLIKVRGAHNVLPCHNWRQSLSTFHLASVLINQLKLVKNKFLSWLETLALVTAALCHCLDSRGSTSCFQLVSGTVLASLYASPGSLAQFYSSSQTLLLICSPDCNFLENLKDEKFYTFATLLVDMIAETNISRHLKKMEFYGSLGFENNYNDKDNKRLLCSLLLNASQINFIVKPWSYSRMIAESCFNELFRKGDLSNTVGVLEINDFNEDLLKLPDLSNHFMETIGFSTFKYLVQVFPVLSASLRMIEENRKLWGSEKDVILASMATEAIGGGGGEGEEIVLINPFKK